MQYDEVIEQVARQADLPNDRAEALTRAFLRVLAVRITGGEAQDLSAQLPADLNAELAEAKEAGDRAELPRISAASAGPARRGW